MILRIFFSLLLLISILFWPFWVSLILGLMAIIYFSFFLEAIILFFLSDLLFGVKEARFFNIYIISLIFSFLILIVVESLKKKIRSRE
ncbi:MAG: hypothetical protein UR25_C0002G0098 [Candidatus Nomurabacteria bacterium GW2011_GWE1_32_28]|uniref:Uncharacterized protein n=1 Tax=Candidatus Nomurabacteria bacterium GW2011_GWF1_31_48 TaxID=1618767 RepID=A0A0G0BHP9_9BACT|nr:MAG: hypothetical protein UR10_C0002G0098 [Candidatus Nomurabacteria bacterium GW2011_GWF2_30_133]KKP29013.1 MAG: hypothetical protein UR18_C0001G0134 [Candidatus Nomurabacteria bacterium GW2011_GWE2_31_40]KKP30577.1 MAG: hypothetical protein UR19_C0002G0098 [Candidatus Nomurabacteria bacterium GW2011_GWF1_31_48]KKP35062.1 MAG: hypothetical protein UR25_C0002G0098 [Candidatus Nomurabacteria bacterium GW2011_GWE1_32_28]